MLVVHKEGVVCFFKVNAVFTFLDLLLDVTLETLNSLLANAVVRSKATFNAGSAFRDGWLFEVGLVLKHVGADLERGFDGEFKSHRIF